MNVHEKDILEWSRYSWTFSCEEMSGTCDELSTIKHPLRVDPHKKNQSKNKPNIMVLEESVDMSAIWY